MYTTAGVTCRAIRTKPLSVGPPAPGVIVGATAAGCPVIEAIWAGAYLNASVPPTPIRFVLAYELASSTSFAGSLPEKAHNIRLAAERLNGTVVPPGGLFSFNREVGPTTLETGYQWGFGITSGADGLHTVPSVAGGICQVATTLFQAFFWGGYRLEERHWHLYWIPAYTSRDVVGLDATVDEDANLDMQFVNTTPHAVLIQASTDADSVTFRLYSTKPDWKVEVAPAQITDRVPADPTPVVEEDATLPAGRRIAVEAAREGFTVVVTRTVTEDGDVRTLPLKSVYQPSRNVTLVGTGGAPAAGGSAQNRPVGDGDRE